MTEPTPITTDRYNATEQWLDRIERVSRYLVPNVTQLSGSLVTDNSFGTALNIFGTGKALMGLVPATSFTGIVYLQLSLSTATSPTTWYDLATYSIGAFKLVDIGTACSLRVGIKTGDYTSGTMAWELKTGGRP